MSDKPNSETSSGDEQPKDPPRPPPDKSWVKTQKGTYSREPGQERPRGRPGTPRGR